MKMSQAKNINETKGLIFLNSESIESPLCKEGNAGNQHFFSHNVSKSLLSQGHQKSGLYDKEFTITTISKNLRYGVC